MTAQALGTVMACTQARKAQEVKDEGSASTKMRLQIQWSSTKSVCCASDCPVIQLHNAHLYGPTFLHHCSLQGQACSWRLGLGHPGHPTQHLGFRLFSERRKKSRHWEMCNFSCQICFLFPRIPPADSQIIFPSKKTQNRKHKTTQQKKKINPYLFPFLRIYCKDTYYM